MAARCETRHLALPVVGLLALSMAACSGNSSGGSGDGVVSSLTAPQEQAAPAQVKPIAFAPVIGAPASVSSKMNEKLIASAGQSNIPVASSGDAEYTIRGYLVAAPDPQGAKLSYIWDVTDKSGKRAQRFQGDEIIQGKKGGDPWASVDDAAIERIAASTTSKIAGWMSGAPAVAEGQNQAAADLAPAADPTPVAASSPPPQRQARSEPPAQAPAPSGGVLSAQAEQRPQAAAAVETRSEIVAVVQPVTGAPGDGQSSLTAAMRRHLESAGVKLIEGDSANAYKVKGSVELGAADSGQQPITIRWLVVNPSGDTMAKAVVQRNKVPEGSLNGEWGQVADLAASEAAKSVAKLIKPTG
ncbi:MAG: hypothetical protein ACFCUR_14345 [Rhodomicrobiaceae bacterium]